MQEEMLRELQERMTANIRAMAPGEMLKAWLPASIAGWEQMQQMFTRMTKRE